MTDKFRHTILFTVFMLMQHAFTGCHKELLPEPEPTESESGLMQLDGAEGFLDVDSRTLMFPLQADSVDDYRALVGFQDYESMWFNGSKLVEGEENQLGKVSVAGSYMLVGEKETLTDTFFVVFTKIPLMRIQIDTKIRDEPKLLCSIQIHSYDDPSKVETDVFESLAGVEIRGRSSTRYVKKSYGLELWEDASENDYIASLLGLRASEDWILDAMYVDRSRMRNKLAFDLWEEISGLPSASPGHSIYPGVRSRFVELFINDSYEGVYNLMEKLDEHILQFNKYQYETGGVMYKAMGYGEGSTSFDTCCAPYPEGFLWESWEQIYPDHETMWEPLETLRYLVVHSDDEEFSRKIGEMADIGMLADYYLYINLLMALDNIGKNTFLARFNSSSPFFILPWDVEASLGKLWDGKDAVEHIMATNNLFNRLKETNAGDFNELVEEKWEAFREGEFSTRELQELATAYGRLLDANGSIQRENERWDLDIDITAEAGYIVDWLEARMEYLTHQFD